MLRFGPNERTLPVLDGWMGPRGADSVGRAQTRSAPPSTGMDAPVMNDWVIE